MTTCTKFCRTKVNVSFKKLALSCRIGSLKFEGYPATAFIHYSSFKILLSVIHETMLFMFCSVQSKRSPRKHLKHTHFVIPTWRIMCETLDNIPPVTRRKKLMCRFQSKLESDVLSFCELIAFLTQQNFLITLVTRHISGGGVSYGAMHTAQNSKMQFVIACNPILICIPAC